MYANEIQLKRLAATYEQFTKEDVVCEQICDVMYVYGSELACLRLFYALRFPEHKEPTVGYSEALGTWWFSFVMSV